MLPIIKAKPAGLDLYLIKVLINEKRIESHIQAAWEKQGIYLENCLLELKDKISVGPQEKSGTRLSNAGTAPQISFLLLSAHKFHSMFLLQTGPYCSSVHVAENMAAKSNRFTSLEGDWYLFPVPVANFLGKNSD